MRLRQVRLQLQRALRERARFFAALRGPVERMQNPAFQLRVPSEGEREVWIELDRAFVELLALFQFVKILKSAGKVTRLDKSKISLAIFSGFALHLRFFS